jgi:hypothetical protein
MAKRYHLARRQRVPRPLAEVFPFFADAGNLQRITPPEVGFRILTPLPIDMKPGAIIEYRIRLHGISLGWRTLIEEFEPGVRFVDSQLSGPYRLWRHTHRFVADGDATVVEDDVEYELPLGVLGRIAHAVVVEAQLRRIFDHRRRVIDEVFPSR